MSHLEPSESCLAHSKNCFWDRRGVSDGNRANLLTLQMETEAQGDQASACEGKENRQALGLRPGFNSPLSPSLVSLGNYLTPLSPCFSSVQTTATRTE